MSTLRDKLEFVALLSDELKGKPLPGIGSIAKVFNNVPTFQPCHITSLAMDIFRLASTHGRLMTEKCNRQLTEREERKIENIRVRLAKVLGGTGIKLNCGGDPRGYTIKLILPSGRYNTWGGADEGWGVPNS